MYRQALLDLEKFLLLVNNGTQKDLSSLPGVGKKTLKQLLELKMIKPNRVALKDIINSTCVGVGTLKKITGNEHVGKLVQFCQYFEETFQLIEKPASIVSIDVGMSNIATAYVSSSLSILSWKYLQFNPPKPYTPGNLFFQVSHLLNNLPLSDTNYFIIEGQSHRTLAGPAAGFMDIGLRLRLIEAMLYGVARQKGLKVFCVSPKMVSKYFETNRNGQYYKKKQATTALTCHLVGAGGFDKIQTPLGNVLNVPVSLVEQYWQQKKMDDLSDCLLQAVSFFEWQEMSRVW